MAKPLLQTEPSAAPSPDTPLGHALVDAVRSRLATHFKGKPEIIEQSLAAFLGGGHLLLEGPPGTGKTSLAKAMAGAFGGGFRRVQMTSDLLPSDVVGILRLKPGTTEFEFRPGPIFTNFLLADELNRTGPKTQSALLEAMAEGTVTVDGKSHALPRPFFVAATQNPLEFQGVYPLAESQLDRFMLCLTVSSPDKEHELEIYRSHTGSGAGPTPDAHASDEAPVLDLAQTSSLLREIQRMPIEASVLEYLLDLVRATRFAPGVAYGVSIRGGLQFLSAAKALAFVRGRDFVIPRDVSDLAVPALAHRLCFAGGQPDPQRRPQLVQEILERVRAPR